LGPMLAGWPLFKLLNFYAQNWRLLLSHLGWFGLLLALLIVIFVRYRDEKAQKKRRVFEGFSFRLSFQLLKSKPIWMVAFYSGFSYMSVALLGTLWGVTYLKSLGLSPSVAAFSVSLLWFGLAIGCPVMGLVSDLILRRKSLLVFCAGLGFIVSLFILYSPIYHAAVFMILYFLLGVSGAGQSIAFNVAKEISPQSIHAVALGFNNTMIGLANLIFIPLIGFIIYQSFQGTFEATTSVYQHSNFLTAFLMIPILYLISVVISVFFIKETYCRQKV
jgi:MFS family permease